MFQESTSQPEWSCMRLPCSRGDPRARDERQEDVRLAEDLVDLDQERGALDRVEFLLGAL
jgi:hypothetical protein